jgi:hypothetical protein
LIFFRGACEVVHIDRISSRAKIPADNRRKSNGREASMPTAMKIILTGICVVALAWPLLFWGEPALPEDGVYQRERQQPSHVFGRHDLLW